MGTGFPSRIDDLDAAHGAVNALVATEIALDERLEVASVPGREVVEHAYVIATLEQHAHKVRPYEPPPPVTSTRLPMDAGC